MSFPRKRGSLCRTKKNQAFTLIEILLVITIIAVILALAILTYRLRMQSNRVQKAAIEMQHVMEAAMTYRVDQQQWPKQNNNFPNCVFSGGDFINYLPNHDYVSNFGNNFCWGTEGSNKQLFWVAVKAPGQGREAIKMAQRIAARLPNAIITADPNTDQPGCQQENCYVRAEISNPGISTHGDFIVLAAGNCRASTERRTVKNGNSACRYIGLNTRHKSIGAQFHITTTASCPVGMTEKIILNPNWMLQSKIHSIGYVGFPLVNVQAQTFPNSACYAKSGCCQIRNRGGTECFVEEQMDYCETNGSCVPYDIMKIPNATSKAEEGLSYQLVCEQETNKYNTQIY